MYFHSAVLVDEDLLNGIEELFGGIKGGLSDLCVFPGESLF